MNWWRFTENAVVFVSGYLMGSVGLWSLVPLVLVGIVVFALLDMGARK